MQGCLGIYIQKNVIKYAKISKEHNNFKVEAYGVKFYDTELEEIIEQIVKETFSYQIPISVNIEKEKYTYANVFNLLKPQDREKAIDTEFEFFCSNNNKNKNTIEVRNIKSPNYEDRDKIRVIYTYTDKVNIVERMQLLDRYKISNISPAATVINNLNKAITQQNCAIVNIENNTEITTLVNGTIYQIDKIEQGMDDILNTIAEKENSIKKAYEICKNTTVYTRSGQNLKIDGNEYLDDIITRLFEIIEKVKEKISSNGIQINSIYLTGMGLIINNIDLLFQENFIDNKCEILVPYFVEKTNVKINIKDYLEVNSAIALALQGLETKKQETNFSNKGQTLEKIMKVLAVDVKSAGMKKMKPKKRKISFKAALSKELDLIEKLLLRGTTSVLLLIILYIASTEVLTKEINEKIKNAETVIEQSKAEIAKITEYDSMIKSRTSQYQEMVEAIENANSELSENYSSKNAIPNLLNKIMYNIPQGVQLLSIENQTNKTITITAQAKQYDQLGYFKAVLEEEEILTNITTTKGEKQGELINITITGELPY